MEFRIIANRTKMLIFDQFIWLNYSEFIWMRNSSQTKMAAQIKCKQFASSNFFIASSFDCTNISVWSRNFRQDNFKQLILLKIYGDFKLFNQVFGKLNSCVNQWTLGFIELWM